MGLVADTCSQYDACYSVRGIPERLDFFYSSMRMLLFYVHERYYQRLAVVAPRRQVYEVGLDSWVTVRVRYRDSRCFQIKRWFAAGSADTDLY